MTRRELLAAAAAAIPGLCRAGAGITSPEISEQTSPAEQIWVETPDGNKATAILRRPPGAGKLPVMIFLHGGLTPRPVSSLKQWSLAAPTQCRALAAGYVILAPTFRRRDEDPQSTDALVDCLAMVRYAKKLAGVDPASVVVYGCSGGGSLALEVAGEETLAAIVAEEPAGDLFAGMMNKSTPKSGPLHTPADARPIWVEPKKYYTPELQQFTRAKVRKIRCPILIVHSDQHLINRVNEQILVPELKAASKDVQEFAVPSQPHCFAFWGDHRTEEAAAVFAKVQKYLETRLKTKPKPVDATLVHQVPLRPTAMLTTPGLGDVPAVPGCSVAL
ncbi:MAG: alpha/beta fold hydrolase [Acidobacteria bacterium]|nr:alpha/beta fold hydrolase [Acidobacteriota bacterium]